MITEKIVCRKCGSANLVKNGSNAVGNSKSKCKDCGFSGVLQTKTPDKSTKEKIAKAYQERSSLRGVGRIFGVSHQSALNWTKKKAMNSPTLPETLLSSQDQEVLELDELCSYVYQKVDKSWLWPRRRTACFMSQNQTNSRFFYRRS